jgi:hypothetical protein
MDRRVYYQKTAFSSIEKVLNDVATGGRRVDLEGKAATRRPDREEAWRMRTSMDFAYFRWSLAVRKRLRS